MATINSYKLDLTNSVTSYSGYAFGETFVVSSNHFLTSYSRYLYRNGTRTGNLVAKVYSLTGTYGTSATPDTLLATSDTVVANGINYSIPGDYTVFTFSGAEQIQLLPGQYYMTVESSTNDYGFLTNAPNDQSDAVGDSAYLDGASWVRDTPGFAFGVFGTVQTLETIVSNTGGTSTFTLGYGQYNAASQSFYSTRDVTLDSCVFELQKVLAPEGNAVAKIYAHTGVFGTSSKPTGTALATSGTLDVTTFTTSMANYTFVFYDENRITLTKDTYYVVTFEYTNSTADNYVRIRLKTSGSTGIGNEATRNGVNWITNATYDLNYYIYGIFIPVEYSLDTTVNDFILNYPPVILTKISIGTKYFKLINNSTFTLNCFIGDEAPFVAPGETYIWYPTAPYEFNFDTGLEFWTQTSYDNTFSLIATATDGDIGVSYYIRGVQELTLNTITDNFLISGYPVSLRIPNRPFPDTSYLGCGTSTKYPRGKEIYFKQYIPTIKKKIKEIDRLKFEYLKKII